MCVHAGTLLACILFSLTKTAPPSSVAGETPNADALAVVRELRIPALHTFVVVQAAYTALAVALGTAPILLVLLDAGTRPPNLLRAAGRAS
jgi:hypothetical protein